MTLYIVSRSAGATEHLVLTVEVSITRFKRLLPRARLEVRRLTHTLHIPPAQPEFYGGPQDGWLRDILECLPCLQSLIVSNLSFFDHQSLQVVHHRDSLPAHDDATHGLKLLIASECENTTAPSLTAALTYFPDLLYLDLSSTHGSRNPGVLRQISALHQLHVLIMKNCGLRDYDLEWLSFSPNLRSLDVSDNYLTARGISNIFERLPAARLKLGRPIPDSPNTRRLRSKRPALQVFVAQKLTNGLDSHHYIDDGLPHGFADLHLAGNFLSIAELTKILRYPTIEYLDCGSLNCSQSVQEMLSPGSPGSNKSLQPKPEVDILSPAMFTEAFRNIRSLRIHYSVITSRPFSGKELPVAEQCFELHSEDLRYELDSTELARHGLMFELDDTSGHSASGIGIHPESDVKSADPPTYAHTSFESPDDVGPALSLPPPIEMMEGHEVILPMNVRHSLYNEAEVDSVASAEVSSVKPIPPKIFISPNSTLVPATAVQSIKHKCPPVPENPPPGPELYQYRYAAGPERCWNQAGQSSNQASTLKERIEEIVQRRYREEARERHPGRFKPSMLPNLKILTLTDIPTTTRRLHILESFTMLIQEYAEEEEIARLESLERNGHVDESADPIKLQRLILEMSKLPEPFEVPQTTSTKRNSFTKSSTEDQDSEMFMAATECDFTFFGEDDGGLLVSAGRIDAPIRLDDGMIVRTFVGGAEGSGVVDVITALSGWRKERKAKWERLAISHGERLADKALCGHWIGEIKVVR